MELLTELRVTILAEGGCEVLQALLQSSAPLVPFGERNIAGTRRRTHRSGARIQAAASGRRRGWTRRVCHGSNANEEECTGWNNGVFGAFRGVLGELGQNTRKCLVECEEMCYMTKDIDADARKYTEPRDYMGAEIERREVVITDSQLRSRKNEGERVPAVIRPQNSGDCLPNAV